MALQVWTPNIDYLFPGVNSFVDALYHVNPLDWGPSLFRDLGQQIWDFIIQTGRRHLGDATRAAVEQSASTLFDLLARATESATWYVVETPVSTYRFLEDYYRQAPILRPDARRGLAIGMRDDILEPIPVPQRLEKVAEFPKLEEPSGQKVAPTLAPGGAHQRSCPDWMLPLILGLYGTVFPGWKAEVQLLENQEHGPQKTPRRRTLPRSQAPYQGRHRSLRSKNRSR
ncbi:putative VP3 [Gammapolyomavirus corvi]|nr:putative VP3 [Crow polyomavirus]ABB04265.1 putative VP3 [Gammapolyomavirus corvi]